MAASEAAHAALRAYLRGVERLRQQGNATEHTYRPDLRDLLQAILPGVSATNEPKRVACGAPDFVIARQTPHGPLTIGYLEAKDISVSLDETEKSEQLHRYLRSLPNLVLTDYLEFRWYVNGERRMTARLATPQSKGALRLDPDGMARVAELLALFIGARMEPIRDPRDLAERLARLAHMIRDIAIASFAQGKPSALLKGLLTDFQRVLLPDLTPESFADMFAQTLAYGLFAARQRHQGSQPFRRQDAAREIPRTNPFLRRLFATITGPDLDDEPFVGFVDDLAQLLDQTDMAAVLADFGKRTKREDPIVHFYETFLTAYDPRLRELRGVYYTPEPVVSYITRSVDGLLRSRFGCAEGLADTTTIEYAYEDKDGKHTAQSPRVLLLDPACGTGTFLYAVVDHIREQFRQRGAAGMWPGYVSQHLLPRLFGFELLMAPYAMAHLKLGLQLAAADLPAADRDRWAYQFESDERLGVFLTNTLEEAIKRTETLTQGFYISDEANEAAALKKTFPVMVVLGNPPYSGHSANKGKWITDLLHGRIANSPGDYFSVDGRPLGERNPKWLNDDYVKFIRFAQWRIEQTGYGALAFITNHSYLDNPTFRGMRQSLLQTFDAIYLLDLHGNSKKKERAPDGGKDENVFDIQQGVAIGIFVRLPPPRPSPAAAGEGEKARKPYATVHHADVWGARDAKYAWLAAHDLADTRWQTLTPQAPFYLFAPQDTTYAEEYQRGWRVTDILPTHSLGIVTARDDLTIGFTRDEVWNRVTDFASLAPEDAREQYNLGPDAQDWKVSLAQQDVRASGPAQEKLAPILYRPFDVRQTYYTGNSRGFQCRPRSEVMRHMLAGKNLGLLTTRQVNEDFHHAFCTRLIADNCAVSLESKERTNLLPLYLYPTGEKSLWDGEHGGGATGRRPNLAPAFIARLEETLGLAFIPDGTINPSPAGGGPGWGPEDVFHYIYAVCHAPEYRSRYADYLKLDFPRIPLTSDRDLFRALCKLGARLVALHLMEDSASPLPLGEGQGRGMINYPERGSNIVERVAYTPPGANGWEQGRVWINTTQYFEGVAPEVWEFTIGGYQVCQKWLKDRKGRKLTYDDLNHYAWVVAALAETMRLMEAIDETIMEHGGWPLT